MRYALVALLVAAGCSAQSDAPRGYRIDNVKVSCKTTEFRTLPDSFRCTGEAEVKQVSGPTAPHILYLEVLKDGKAEGRTSTLVRDSSAKIALYHSDDRVAKGAEPKPPTFTFNVIGTTTLQSATLVQ